VSLSSRVSQKMGWKGLVPLMLSLLLAVGVAVVGFGRAVPAHAAGDSLAGLPAPDAQSAGPFDCTINNIAVFPHRIHVHCTTAVSGISYFAASGDGANALATNRFMVLLNTAYSLGKHVYIYYYTDTADNPSGCNASDCRGIYWMFIVQ